MAKPITLRNLSRPGRLDTMLSRGWEGVTPERKREIQEAARAAVEWEALPIGTGAGTREATIRERLGIYHARYCMRKYALWDLLTMWAKWQLGAGPPQDTAERDLCIWLAVELDRQDPTRHPGAASISATLTTVLVLMREQLKANALPSLPSWDEKAERAAMMKARAARRKSAEEAAAEGFPAPAEHPTIASYFDPRCPCPPAFFAKRKGARRGHA